MKGNQHEHIKLRTVFTFSLLLVSTSLLVPRPAFSAEKVLEQTSNSNVIHTVGPVTSSLYFQRDFVKRQAAFIRRNPTAVPSGVCDDMAPNDPTGIIKIVCRTVVARIDRFLEAADANKCLKVRFVHPASILSAATLDNSKYCR